MGKHPESLCGVSRNQLTSTVNGENPGSRPWWSMHTSWMTPQSDHRALLSLDNNGLCFRTGQGHCGAGKKKWKLSDSDQCSCGETQTLSHIVKSYPQTRLHSGLSKLHSADDDAAAWLTSYGSWCIRQQQQLQFITRKLFPNQFIMLSLSAFFSNM